MGKADTIRADDGGVAARGIAGLGRARDATGIADAALPKSSIAAKQHGRDDILSPYKIAFSIRRATTPSRTRCAPGNQFGGGGAISVPRDFFLRSSRRRDNSASPMIVAAAPANPIMQLEPSAPP